MPTIGQTSELTDFAFAWQGETTPNLVGIQVTMPTAGTITRMGGWIRGYINDCSFRWTIWNSSNAFLRQTGTIVADGASLSTTAGLNYEADLTSPLAVTAGQVLYLGSIRAGSGGMQYGRSSSGTHYEKDGTGWSDDFSGKSSETGLVAVYAEYTVGSESYVRRSGVWVKANPLAVRRGGAWIDPTANVYVRRSGVWVPA